MSSPTLPKVYANVVPTLTAPAEAPVSTPHTRQTLIPELAPRTQPAVARVPRERPAPALLQVHDPSFVVERMVNGHRLRSTMPDRDAFTAFVAEHYKGCVGNPRFHVAFGEFDLNAHRVGRWNETGQLEAVVLSPPYALGGEWTKSPIAATRGDQIDVQRAMAEHATLARFYLERGVEVHLLVMNEQASQAVYATDVLTAMGPLAVLSNPRHAERQAELLPYSGGVRMASYGKSAPVEWGDVQLHYQDDKLYVLQAIGSLRSRRNSVDALGRMLREHREQLGPYEHVVIELNVFSEVADSTLHLDYTLGQAGEGANRIMTVSPERLRYADSDIPKLQRILGVRDENVITVGWDESTYGATNLACLNGREITCIEDPRSARVVEEVRRRGIIVHAIALPEISSVDGTVHCMTGQLRRQRPF